MRMKLHICFVFVEQRSIVYVADAAFTVAFSRRVRSSCSSRISSIQSR
jgi:hypothetical protein